MKAPLNHPLFLTSLLTYATLFVLKKAEVYIPLLSDYGADVLALPVVLSITLWGIRRSRTDRRQYTFSIWHILFTLVLYGFLFEWWFPRISERHTSDPWDLLAYAIGAGLFAFFLNRSPRPQ